MNYNIIITISLIISLLLNLYSFKNKDIKKILKEFSKIMLSLVTVFVVSLTIFTCVMIYITKDLSPLSYLIPAWFLEFGVATGFYYNKAKAENLVKLSKTYNLNIKEILKYLRINHIDNDDNLDIDILNSISENIQANNEENSENKLE